MGKREGGGRKGGAKGGVLHEQMPALTGCLCVCVNECVCVRAHGVSQEPKQRRVPVSRPAVARGK